MHEAHFESIYLRVLRAAQIRSRAAVATGAIPLADREDAIQDALFACWRALASFDPTRASLQTYLERVISSRLTSFIRANKHFHFLCPLDLAADHRADPFSERLGLRSDIQRLLRTCSNSEQRLAMLLMESTPTEASERLGIARSTIYERIRKLRPKCIAAGVHPRRLAKRTSPTNIPTSCRGTALVESVS